MFIAKEFISKMENISYYIAAGKIDKKIVRKIMVLVLDGEYDTNEEIKLEIYNAIKD